MTTHPASIIMLRDRIKNGEKSRFLLTKGRRLETYEDKKDGVCVAFYEGEDDKNPFVVSNLTIEQADAISWGICKFNI